VRTVRGDRFEPANCIYRWRKLGVPSPVRDVTKNVLPPYIWPRRAGAGRLLIARGQSPAEIAIPQPLTSRAWLAGAVVESSLCHRLVERRSSIQRNARIVDGRSNAPAVRSQFVAGANVELIRGRGERQAPDRYIADAFTPTGREASSSSAFKAGNAAFISRRSPAPTTGSSSPKRPAPSSSTRDVSRVPPATASKR
jgi:hypothetical protein